MGNFAQSYISSKSIKMVRSMKIIGQKRLLQKINQLNELPRFIILEGSKGGGKKLISKYIANKFNLVPIFIGTKVDDIRNMIQLANTINDEVLFIIDEGNKLSIGAKNALLKVCEEVPRNAYIILTCENKEVMISTLLSRAMVLQLDNYFLEDYKEFAQRNSLEIFENIELTYPNLSYFNLMSPIQGQELLNFSEKVLDNIKVVSGANAFKIANSIQLKEEQEGYDFEQFLFCLKSVVGKRLLNKAEQNQDFSEEQEYIDAINAVNRYINNPSISKAYLLDKLILDLKGL